MRSLYSHVRHTIDRYKDSLIIKDTIRHNKSVFPQYQVRDGSPVILVEVNSMASSVIAYAYIATTLANKYDATVVGFCPTERESNHYRNGVAESSSTTEIYRSFGAETIIFPTISDEMDLQAREICGQLEQDVKTKSQFEDLCVNGVEIGSLVYDSYLRQHKAATIELGSRELSESLLTGVREFLFWEKYFGENEVCGVNVSHCVYTQALPLRVALHLDVPAYQVNATHIYRLNRKDTHAYNESRYFPEIFRSIDQTQKGKGLELARRRLEKRFAGVIGSDIPYSTKSAFTKRRYKGLLSGDSGRKQILLATHCFSDSPHAYGKNLFPDFYEWMKFLGELSLQTDYDWYLKTHPDFLATSKEFTQIFVDKYPRFNMLPSDCSHRQLVDDGIDVCLTVFGTIAYEYAAMGVPTITASSNCPTIAYDFNYHPRTVDEYRDVLLNLDTFTLTIDIQKIYEWYFMTHIYYDHNWLFDYDSVMQALGGYYEQFQPKMYRYWIKKCWNSDKHRRLIESLTCFVNSGDLRLEGKHLSGQLKTEAR